MKKLNIVSIYSQIAAHIRQHIIEGYWKDYLPGLNVLASELNVNRKTISLALEQLEKEGYLEPQGARKRRRIVLHQKASPTKLRVAVLSFDNPDEWEPYIRQLPLLLQDAGHDCFIARSSLLALGMNPLRVAKLVADTSADAWIVGSASKEVLEWFAEQPFPTFALCGRRGGLPIAGIGPDKISAICEAVRHLIGLGHKRIVAINRRDRRYPEPGTTEKCFLNELEAHGISTGSYNLPDWDDSSEYPGECLDRVFRLTPPTAILAYEPSVFLAVQNHLARRGIFAPEHISLMATDWDPNFRWMKPTIAHIRWDYSPWLRRVSRWVDNISRGRGDIRQSLSKAKFINGETLAPINLI